MNRFLLDTCTLLDWATDPSQLQDTARIAIADARSHVFVSAATAWDIAVKCAVGALNALADLASLLRANRFNELPVTIAHVQATSELPLTAATRRAGADHSHHAARGGYRRR